MQEVNDHGSGESWLLSKDNVSVIPKASSEHHILDNFAALDLELAPEEIDRIDSIDRTVRYFERAVALIQSSSEVFELR